MRKKLMGMVAAGVMMMSVTAMADDDKMDTYNDMLERQYSHVQVEDKKYELEYDVKDLDSFMLLEVEVEDSFLGKKHTDIQVAREVEPIIEKVSAEITEDFNKPVKVIVEYEDRNILIKKY